MAEIKVTGVSELLKRDMKAEAARRGETLSDLILIILRSSGQWRDPKYAAKRRKEKAHD